jgi:hypothetical protein
MKARLVAHERARKSFSTVQVIGMNSCAALSAQTELLPAVAKGSTQINPRSLNGRSARKPMMQNALAGRGMTAAFIKLSATTVVAEVS